MPVCQMESIESIVLRPQGRPFNRLFYDNPQNFEVAHIEDCVILTPEIQTPVLSEAKPPVPKRVSVLRHADCIFDAMSSVFCLAVKRRQQKQSKALNMREYYSYSHFEMSTNSSNLDVFIPQMEEQEMVNMSRHKKLIIEDDSHLPPPQPPSIFEKISSYVTNLRPSVPTFTMKHDMNFPDEAKESLSTISGAIKDVQAYLKPVKQGVADMTAFVPRLIDAISTIILVIFNIIRAKDNMSRILLLIEKILLTGLVSVTSLATKFAKLLATLFELFIPASKELKIDVDTPFVPQAGDSPLISDELHTDIIHVMIDCVKGWFPQSEARFVPKPQLSTFKSIVNDLKNAHTIGRAIEYLSKSAWFAISYVYHFLTGRPLYTSSTSEILGKCAVWIDQTLHVMTKNTPGSMAESTTFCQEIIDAYNVGNDLAQELMLAQFTKANFTVFFTTLNRIKDLKDSADICLHTARARIPPIVVSLTGVPGKGKSNLATMLANDLAEFYSESYCSRKFDMAQVIWPRKSSVKHWDGYNNPFAVLYDDYMQHDDKEINTATAEELIYASNSAPFMLEMSYVDDKGKFYFDSKVIFLTSNSIKIPPLALQDKRAFSRRIDLLVEVSDNPDVKEPGMSRNHYCMRYIDPSTQTVDKTVPLDISYFDLCELLKVKLIKKHEDIAMQKKFFKENSYEEDLKKYLAAGNKLKPTDNPKFESTKENPLGFKKIDGPLPPIPPKEPKEKKTKAKKELAERVEKSLDAKSEVFVPQAGSDDEDENAVQLTSIFIEFADRLVLDFQKYLKAKVNVFDVWQLEYNEEVMSHYNDNVKCDFMYDPLACEWYVSMEMDGYPMGFGQVFGPIVLDPRGCQFPKELLKIFDEAAVVGAICTYSHNNPPKLFPIINNYDSDHINDFSEFDYVGLVRLKNKTLFINPTRVEETTSIQPVYIQKQTIQWYRTNVPTLYLLPRTDLPGDKLHVICRYNFDMSERGAEFNAAVRGIVGPYLDTGLLARNCLEYFRKKARYAPQANEINLDNHLLVTGKPTYMLAAAKSFVKLDLLSGKTVPVAEYSLFDVYESQVETGLLALHREIFEQHPTITGGIMKEKTVQIFAFNEDEFKKYIKQDSDHARCIQADMADFWKDPKKVKHMETLVQCYECRADLSNQESFLSTVYNNFVKHVPYLGTVLSIIGAGLALVASKFLWNYVWSQSVADYTSQSNERNPNVTPVRHPQVQRSQRQFVKFAPQDQCLESVSNMCYRNSCEISYVFGTKRRNIQCLFIKDNICISAKHFFLVAPIDTIFTFDFIDVNRNSFQVALTDLVIVLEEENDLAFIEVPAKKMTACRNIVDKFATAKWIADNDVSKTVLVVPLTDNQKWLESNSTRKAGAVSYCLEDSLNKDVVTSYSTFHYPNETVGGQCGSPLLVRNPRAISPIIGIHIAGREGQQVGGASTCVTREAVEAGLKAFTSDQPVILEPQSGSASQVKQELLEQFNIEIVDAKPQFSYNDPVDFYGAMPSKYAHRFSTKSQIVPSVLQLDFTPTTAPAKLAFDRENNILPVQLALQKVGQPLVNPRLDYKLREEIKWATIKSILPLVPPRLLSMTEAINGVPSWEHTGSMFMSTSYGFDPLKKSTTGGKKKHFYQLGGLWVPDEYTANRVQYLKTAYAAGRSQLTISQVNQKDERRELEKVRLGKTRLIVSQETPHLILGRMYYGAFMDNCSAQHIKIGIMAGLNPHSTDWANQVDREIELSKANPVDLAGDASTYDWSNENSTSEYWRDIVNCWYKYWSAHCPEISAHEPVHDMIRNGIDKDQSEDIVMQVGADLIHPHKGFLSGGFATGLKNSIDGQYEHKYCFLTVVQKIRSMYQHKEHLQARTYIGDGVAISDERYRQYVKDTNCFKIGMNNIDNFMLLSTGGDDFRIALCERSTWYTFPKLKALMFEVFGRTYTATDKTDVVGSGHKPYLSEKYLARGFRRADGLVYAPMDIPDILEIMLWRNMKLDPVEALQANVRCAFKEFFHHGRKIYDEWKDKINAALYRRGHDPFNMTWDDFYEEYQDAGSSQEWAPQSGVVPAITQVENTQESGEINVTELTQTIDTLTIDKEIPTIRLQPFYRGTDPYKDQGLSTVLERLYRIETISWTSSSTFNTQLALINFPYALVNASTNLQEKLSYFDLMRADVEVEFRINSTEFHYGMLLGGWVPPMNTGTTMSTKIDNVYTSSTENGFLLSANSPNPLMVTIPYIGAKQYYSTSLCATNNAYNGAVFLYVLVPLNIIGSSSVPAVDISVWARFKNIEVAAPSLVTVTAMRRELALGRRAIRELLKEGKWKPQAGSKKNSTKPNLEAEQKSETGVVSGVLDSVGGLSSMVASTGLLGPYSGIAAGVSAVAGIGSSIAKLFGYNKPLSLETTKPIRISTVNSMSSGSGLLSNETLALYAENHTSNKPENYGVKYDEHQLVNLFTKPGLIEVWSFDSTSTAGEIVHTYYVTPMTCPTYTFVYTGSKNMTKQYHTPLSIVAYNFYLWRGSIKYSVVISCSRYTTGRLRISWHPTYAEIPADFSDGEGDFISVVVDFKGDTTFNFTIPYLQDYAYKQCEDTWLKHTFGTNGALAFSIVNPVTSSTSVGSSTVYVAVFIAGDTDMKFVQMRDRPNASTYSREIITTPAALPSSGWVAQSGEADSCILNEIFSGPFPTIIEAKSLSVDFVHEGEAINDVLTMLHRFHAVGNGQITLTNQTYSYVSPSTVFLNNSDDVFNIFTRWFMYRRGGHNYKLVRSYQATAIPNGVVNVNLGVFDYETATIVNPGNLLNPFSRNGTLLEDSGTKPSLEWSEPYVSSTAFTENTGLGLYTYEEVGSWLYWETLSGSSATTQVFRLFHSCADDFSMGCAFGVPILAYYQP